MTSAEIVRLHEDGAVDRSFNAGMMAIHGFTCRSVSSIALQTDGKVVVGGQFISTNYERRDYVARLRPNGDLDEAFTPANAVVTALSGPASSISYVKVQNDGGVLIAGSFGVINSTARNHIARLNADGSLDASFDSGTGAQLDGILSPASVHSVGLQTDGKVLVAGNFTSFAGTNRKHIARLNLNGSLDTTFDPGSGASSFVWCVALQADGKVLAGGEFTMMNGTNRSRLARLHTNGRLDDTFDPGIESAAPAPDVSAIAVQDDGKVLLAGASFTVDSFDPPLVDRIASLSHDGSLDTNFTRVTANGNVFAMALQADGKALIAGNFTVVNATNRNCVARLNGNGTLDDTFDPGTGPNSIVYAAAAQPDGKVFIGGIFTAVNGTNRNRIARLNTDGRLDTTFDPGTGANSDVRAIVLQPDGKVLLGGSFTNVNGFTRRGLARLEPDGSVDQAFDPEAGGRAVVLQPDGKVLVGGISGVSRLEPDGPLDGTFWPARVNSGMFVKGIYSMALQSDGKIVVVGSFSSINGVSRYGIARLNADGTLDTTFNPAAANGEVYSVAVQADGRMLIGGGFSRVGMMPRNRIARLLGDGAVLIWGPVRDDGDFVARFRGMPGWGYTLEYAESLGGIWQKLTNWTAPTSDLGWGVGVFELREAIGDSRQRFYRMVDPAY